MAQEALRQYRARRDFRRTPEPKGSPFRNKSNGRFVIQKHAARRLHYDFRLELDGTLKSWAIPKGPSFNPQDKRLAVQVEDHPLEYARFEGIVPKNQYGAGTVMLWDTGRWVAEDDNPGAAYDKGHLRFTLKGTKVQGSWSLVRMHGRSGYGKNWLLIKHADAFAADQDAEDLDAHSVASHRTIEQIAADKDKSWDAIHSKSKINKPVKQHKSPRKGRKAAMPEFLAPQLASLVASPPQGEQWLHEIKYDGYRIMCHLNRGKTIMFSRNSRDWSERFPIIYASVKKLGLSSAWLDGEVCFIKADGRSDFQALQNALKEKKDPALVYFVFDLLYLNGKDLSLLALLERKQILAEILQTAGDIGPVKYADHLSGHGEEFYRQACEHKLEGIVSKRADRPYREGRSHEWLKIKCLRRQEFVIGGYTQPRGRRSGFGALLLGVFENQRFVYSGKVGTGFNEDSLRHIYSALEKTRVSRSFYDEGPPRDIARGAIWVKPSLVAEIEFKNWTGDGYLRQPSFKGLREDKKAGEVNREGMSPSDSEPLPTMRRSSVAGVSLSNPEKILYSQHAISKRDLALYYELVAPWMLPYVVHRPLTLVRCPNGYDQPCFFQKHDVDAYPDNLQRVTIQEKGKPEHYLSVQSVAGLISLVQMGVLEIHTWGARIDAPQHPDLLVFDIDPQEQLPWETVVGGAQTLHTLLGELSLVSFVKSTGGKGLHVVVPITRRHSWNEIKTFAKAVAGLLVQFDASLYTAKIAKHAREGKMYIDYVRNSEGATAIAPYSTRARQGAPVAVPLSWDELDEGITSNYFTVKNIRHRLTHLKTDPWEGFFSVRQSITKSMRKTLGLGVRDS